MTLTAGLAFAAAWGFATLQEPAGRSGRKPGSRTPGLRQSLDLKPGVESAATPGGMQDALVRQAVEVADLVAGVKEIMARQNEDHCADTRLICMVENLPAARLPELPALLGHFMGDDYVVKCVLSAWAQRDAAGALAYVTSQPALRLPGITAFLKGWTRTAPDAALEWLDTQPLSAQSGTLRTALVETMAEKYPAAALAMMQERGWTAQHPDAVLRLLTNWGGHDPAAALDGLRSLMKDMGLKLEPPDPAAQGYDTRNQSFRSMMQALLYGAFERNPAEAAALLSRLSPEELTAGQSALASEIFGRDPAAADALFVPQPDERTRGLLLALAGSSPATALANLGRLQDQTLRGELLRAATASYHMSEHDTLPAEALPALKETLAGITDEKEHDRTAKSLSMLAASTAPAWAAELWTGLPANQQIDSAHKFILKAAAGDSSAVLSAFSASPPEVQTQALKSLCYAVGARQPEAALQLVLQRTEPALRAECAATLFAAWAGTDEPAAFAALEQNAAALPAESILDRLPQAGQFNLRSQAGASSFSSFSTTATISTTSLRAKLEQLRGSAPASGQ